MGRECNAIQHNNWHALLLIAFTYHTAFCLTALQLVQHELSRFHCITPVLVYYLCYLLFDSLFIVFLCIVSPGWTLRSWGSVCQEDSRSCEYDWLSHSLLDRFRSSSFLGIFPKSLVYPKLVSEDTSVWGLSFQLFSSILHLKVNK